MKTIQAPEKLPDRSAQTSPMLFLAGSVTDAFPWRMKLAGMLEHQPGVILDPERTDWDSSWKERIDDPQFREQVEWELDAQERADVIFMYFDPATKAPISLLELGLSARSGKMLVCCPEGFWRKGNVDIVCKRYGIPQIQSFIDLEEAILAILDRGREP